MSIHIKTGDAWHTCASVHVNVSGTWHTCKQVYVNASGTWKPCILSSQSKTVNGPTAYNATVTLSNVKNGSTVKVTGHAATTQWDVDTGEPIDRRVTFTATGATPDTHNETWTKRGSVDFSYNFTATSTTVKITRGAPNLGAFSITNCKIQYTEEYYP